MFSHNKIKVVIEKAINFFYLFMDLDDTKTITEGVELWAQNDDADKNC